MKVNRVILSSNNNKDYFQFWNPLSKVYKEKFNITPTLIWIGTEEEMIDCKISNDYGDVIITEPNKKYTIASQCAWGSYWATQFFPNEVCFIWGIDEVPLSGIFIKDMVEEIQDDRYVMLISDAYLPDHWTIEYSSSPSGQHIALGSTFMDIYKFEKSFQDEIEKVFNSGTHEAYLSTHPTGYYPVIMEHPNWGTDETYYSHILRNYKGDFEILSLNNFDLMRERRIDCERFYEIPYDLTLLKKGWYSQAHLCRPFDIHQNYIQNLFNNIPIIK
jgi:hypothetical protein